MLPEPDTIQTIDSLEALGAASLVFVDVRPSEAFAEEHIKGAENLCVYEVGFADQVVERFPEKATKLVLYGQDDQFKAADAAFGRLKEIGYEGIAVLRGGLAGWKSAGGPTAGEGPQEDGPVSGRKQLDSEDSILRWTGRNLGNQHDGKVALEGGFLEIDGKGHPLRGEVTVDMRRMSCDDIKDPGLAAQLIAHLSNADFFLVERFPKARIRLETFSKIPESTPGRPNYRAAGSLEIRGVNQPVELELLMAPKGNGVRVQATFDLDRTRHGALYGSGRIFERLGMHLVNDHVHIQVMASFQ